MAATVDASTASKNSGSVRSDRVRTDGALEQRMQTPRRVRVRERQTVADLQALVEEVARRLTRGCGTLEVPSGAFVAGTSVRRALQFMLVRPLTRYFGAHHRARAEHLRGLTARSFWASNHQSHMDTR